MQTFYRRFSVLGGFGILLAILVANAVVTRRQLSVQTGDEGRVIRARQVLYELSETELLLTDAETGQRGFLYTGDPKYLNPYNSAITQVEPHLDHLAQLTATNARETALMPELRVLTGRRLDEMAETIALYRAGKQADARSVVLSDIGRIHMEEIRKVVSEMEEEESKLETARTARYERSVRQTIASIYAATLLAVVGLVLLAYFILREMALRERHAAEIRAREEWFRVTLTSIGDAVIATDRHGKVTFLNPMAERLTGRSLADAIGKDIKLVFPIFNEMTRNVVEDPVEKVMRLGTVVGLANHTVVARTDGLLIPIEDSAAPIRDDRKRLLGVVLVFRDVTNERKAQEVMRKTEKLAAAARLSATVAHEINNPLEAVVNLIYIAKAAPDTPPAMVQTLALAEQELERVAHLTRQTLGFYRESNVPDHFAVAEVIDSVLNLYSNRLKNKNIAVTRHLFDCPPVYGVSGELKQVISNLIANAADAVGRNGRIAVKLECIDNGGSPAAQLVVEDDGPGIAAENIDRIFEPFFTTKEDVGTGLGLWISKEIITRHGGSIKAHSGSAWGHGALFTILLPLTPDLPEHRPRVDGNAPPLSGFSGMVSRPSSTLSSTSPG